MKTRSGFTLIEVMVAVVVLGIGVLALLTSSALVTRMIGRGRVATMAAQLAQTRIEILRQQAMSTSPQCTSLASGSATADARMTERWTVSSPAGMVKTRQLDVVVTYPVARGTRSFTVSTYLWCP